MKGSVFAKTLPPGGGPRREQMIFDAVRRRDIPPIGWSPIQTTCVGTDGIRYRATFQVSTDALRVGDSEDSFRVNVNHGTAQHIADELGVVLPTPFLSDEIWTQAPVRLSSTGQVRNKWREDGTMGDTNRMLQQSAYVDKLIAEEHSKGKRGLIADVGKDWVTTKRLWEPFVASASCEQGKPRAANYGWHTARKWTFDAVTPGRYVLQPVGLCHLIFHTDYSQVVRFVRRDVLVCQQVSKDPDAWRCGAMDIRSVASSKVFSCLVNHDGPLSLMRHPDIPPSCDKGCPDDVNESTNGVNGNGNGGSQLPPQPAPEPALPGGPISCPSGCDKLPSVEPDPTYGVTYIAEMTGAEKVIMFAAGVTVGYYALRRLLPTL